MIIAPRYYSYYDDGYHTPDHRARLRAPLEGARYHRDTGHMHYHVGVGHNLCLWRPVPPDAASEELRYLEYHISRGIPLKFTYDPASGRILSGPYAYSD